MSSNVDLKILQDSIKLVESKVYRDFFEIENLQTSYNSAKNFAKKTIEFLEDKLYSFLKEKRPDYNVVIKNAKNFETEADRKFTIYVNPICGIANFMHGIPYFCTVLTVKERDLSNGKEKIVCGLINNYAEQEMFCVEAGKGSFVSNKHGNNLRLRVSNRADLKNSVISIKYGVDKENLKKLIDKLSLVKVSNCSALDLVLIASGKYDGGFVFDKDDIDNDLGILFVQEAGGFYEINDNNILASNSLLFSELRKLL